MCAQTTSKKPDAATTVLNKSCWSWTEKSFKLRAFVLDHFPLVLCLLSLLISIHAAIHFFPFSLRFLRPVARARMLMRVRRFLCTCTALQSQNCCAMYTVLMMRRCAMQCESEGVRACARGSAGGLLSRFGCQRRWTCLHRPRFRWQRRHSATPPRDHRTRSAAQQQHHETEEEVSNQDKENIEWQLGRRLAAGDM